MTTFTFDTEIFSDLHKDAYGFRPRGHRFYAPETTDEERQRIWDSTHEDVLRSIWEDKAREENAVAMFETRIDQLIRIGAKDRTTAIEWIRQAYDAVLTRPEDDEPYRERIDFIEFDLDLPYGYISNDPAFAA